MRVLGVGPGPIGVPATGSRSRTSSEVALALHLPTEHLRKLLPGLACGIDTVAAGPPLDTATTHYECALQRIPAADLNGHAVLALELCQCAAGAPPPW